MARARLLKPGFFKNEELAKLSFAHRLTFAGLWTLADREGRLEDRPVRIKAELFPYDPVDVEGILDDLAAHGFIQRYAYTPKGAQGVAKVSQDVAKVSEDAASNRKRTSVKRHAIFIPTFVDHQTPHHREPVSRIPAPRSHHRKSKTEAQGQPRASLGPDVGQPESSLSDPETVTGDPVTGDPETVGGEAPPPPDAARINTLLIKTAATNGHAMQTVIKAKALVTAVVETRSKRPIFKGQRFTVFEWQIDQLQMLLGVAFDAFHVDEWFYELDAKMAASRLVIPQRDSGAWLQTQTLEEAIRRGLPVAVATTVPKAGKLTTRLAAAMENIRREGEL